MSHVPDRIGDALGGEQFGVVGRASVPVPVEEIAHVAPGFGDLLDRAGERADAEKPAVHGRAAAIAAIRRAASPLTGVRRLGPRPQVYIH